MMDVTRKLLVIERVGIIAPIVRKWNLVHKAGGSLSERSRNERPSGKASLHMLANRCRIAMASFPILFY